MLDGVLIKARAAGRLVRAPSSKLSGEVYTTMSFSSGILARLA
jgi:hypothetical protein